MTLDSDGVSILNKKSGSLECCKWDQVHVIRYLLGQIKGISRVRALEQPALQRGSGCGC